MREALLCLPMVLRFLICSVLLLSCLAPGMAGAEVPSKTGSIDVPPPPKDDIVIGRHYDLQDDLAPYPWPDMDGPGLPWPENMLGQWRESSRAGEGIVTIEQGKPIYIHMPEDGSLEQIIEYKIFRIQDDYVYAITKTFSFFTNPIHVSYSYRRFYILNPDSEYPQLRIGRKLCALRDLDFKMPPEIHWKRLTRAMCNQEDSFHYFPNTVIHYRKN